MAVEAGAAKNPRVKSYPFSVLVRQHLMLQERFTARYPNAWLVWEAGRWIPAMDPVGVSETQTPNRTPAAPTRADPLCFDLCIPAGEQVRVGRSPECDVVIDDATFSRNQLVIARSEPDRWTASAIPGSGPTRVLGMVLAAEAMSLTPGLLLHVGEVSLTFHTSTSMAALVAASAAKVN